PALHEIIRASLGASFGLVAAGTLARLTLPAGATPEALWLAAPLGATAFLAFAVPNSPLAQPWSAIVGNTLSALIGVGVALAVAQPHLAAGLAIGLAIMAMMLARAMHPPGGAMALLVVLTARGNPDINFHYALSPVMLDTALLVGLATLYNHATGRVYPFRQSPDTNPHATRDRAPERRAGLAPEDLAALLARFNLTANIGTEDLARLIGAAEAEATARHFGGLTCGDMMSRNLITLRPEATLRDLAALFRKHRFKTLPVTDVSGAYLGLINESDLLDHLQLDAKPADSGLMAWLTRSKRLPQMTSTAQDILSPRVQTARPETPIATATSLLADGHQQAVPITEGNRLVGLVTRSDLIAILATALREH
ncbi:MAG: HPP family protein, partial [Paracoccaceae bacterium]|nr:HPP family protein [Paracoccaceae bacterium]